MEDTLHIVLSIILIIFSSINSSSSSSSKKQPPNIIFILADDYGWHDVGYHGSVIHTPNMDALAGAGVKLDNYYVQPICSPTRSCLMTGRYQIHIGLQHFIIWASQPSGVPLDVPTLADKLTEVGYDTHGVGKWHLGFYKKAYMPTNRGFKSYYGYLTSNEHYFSHIHCGGYYPGHPSFNKFCGRDLRDNMKVDWNTTEYSTHLYTKKAQQIIQNHDKSKPLFLYLPYQAVHSPLEVPDSYRQRYSFIKDKQRQTYAAMATCLDEGIGNLTQTLKDNGMYDNTIIIFSTDNGGQVYQGGNNWPFRGWKLSLWEGGMRGVGFVHSPLLRNAGRTSKQLIHVTDWFPTLLRLAGGSTNGTKLDGYDVWDAISQDKPSPRLEILHNIDPLWAHRGSSLYPGIYDTRVRSALRMGDWKIITGEPGNGSWISPPEDSSLHPLPDPDSHKHNLWLFNITADPHERHDLSDAYPQVVNMMLRRLAAYNSTALPVVYPPPDPRSNPKLLGGAWGPWE